MSGRVSGPSEGSFFSASASFRAIGRWTHQYSAPRLRRSQSTNITSYFHEKMLPNIKNRVLMEAIMDLVPVLSYRGSLLVIVGAALCTHMVFKRTETRAPVHLAILLGVVPASLSRLLARHNTSPFLAFLISCLVFWGSLVSSIVLYRLSPWHPLAKYPGPVLCRITKVYWAILSLGGKQHEHFRELHQQYGDVVRIGPNELSFCHANAVKDMMGQHGLPKGSWWDGRIPEGEPIRTLIAIRDKQEHTNRRRPWTRAFSTMALKDYEPMITERVTQLVNHLGKQRGSLDLRLWISYFAYDMMGDLAFGGGTEMMRDGDVDGIWHLLEKTQVSATFVGHLAWFGNLLLRVPVFGKNLKKFRAYTRSRAAERKLKGSSHKDLFHYLGDEDGIYEKPPSHLQVVSDGGLAIVAGSDTTSSALSNLFYFLATHPGAYQRLQAEIDTLGDGVGDYTRLAHLPYLNASINESLRLYPPVLSGSQRYAASHTSIGPNVVPGGTYTWIHPYTIHRDERFFSPLPDSFIPERWLPETEQHKLEPAILKDRSSFTLDQDAFLPFSVGPTNCVGKNFAMMEMRMVICMLMQRFDMRLEEGFDPKEYEESIKDYFVMVKGSLPVVLTPRL